MGIEIGDPVILKRNASGKQFLIKQVNPEVGDTVLTNPTWKPTVIKTADVNIGDLVALIQDKNNKLNIVSTDGSGESPVPPDPATLIAIIPTTGRRAKTIDYALIGTNFPFTSPISRINARLFKSSEVLNLPVSTIAASEIDGVVTIPMDATIGLWSVNYHDNQISPDLQLIDAFYIGYETPWITSVVDMERQSIHAYPEEMSYVEDVHNHWASHNLIGKYIHMLTGDLAGQRAVIGENTAHSRFYIANLMPHGEDCETTTCWSGWGLDGGSGIPHSGDYCLRVYDPSDQGIWTGVYGSCLPSQSVSGFFYCETGELLTGVSENRLFVGFYNVYGNFIGQGWYINEEICQWDAGTGFTEIESWGPGLNDWHEISFTTPANAHGFVLGIMSYEQYEYPSFATDEYGVPLVGLIPVCTMPHGLYPYEWWAPFPVAPGVDIRFDDFTPFYTGYYYDQGLRIGDEYQIEEADGTVINPDSSSD
jgi:hypothetical protein